MARLPVNRATSNMPVTVYLTPEQMAWIVDFARQNQFKGKSDAIRALIDYVINHDDE